jgi:hypothetical protein
MNIRKKRSIVSSGRHIKQENSRIRHALKDHEQMGGIIKRLLLPLILALVIAVPGLLRPASASASEMIDQSQTVSQSSTTVSWNFPRAQIFTAGITGDLTRVSLRLENFTSTPPPGAALFISVQTVSGGLPSGEQIGTGKILLNAIPAYRSGGDWVDVDLSGDPLLWIGYKPYVNAGVQYALVLQVSVWNANVNWWYAGQSAYGSSYTFGEMALNNGSGWIVDTRFDFTFKTYVEPPPYVHTAPTNADLRTYAGDANTLVVQIVNLSPYPLVFKNDTNILGMAGPLGSTPAMDRNAKKSFFFAPLGVPVKIPPPPAQAFVPKYLDNGQLNPNWDPNYQNTETRPYSMVFSWDDRGSPISTYNYVNWTIQGVQCKHDDRCPNYTQDVDLGLFITREIPEISLDAKYLLDLVKGPLKEVFTLIGAIVFPERPMNWIRFFLATAELEKMGYDEVKFNEKQKEPDSNKHGQWLVAAYPIPDLTNSSGVENACYYSKQCTPSSDAADDAVEASWDDIHGGFFADQLVVTTHLLRGKAATNSYRNDPDQCILQYSDAGTMGSAPIAMISIMTKDQWIAGQVASIANGSMPSGSVKSMATGSVNKKGMSSGLELIRSLVQKNGRAAVLELLSIIRELPRQQRQFLVDMLRSWRAGNPLTKQQEAFIQMIAVRLRTRVV